MARAARTRRIYREGNSHKYVQELRFANIARKYCPCRPKPSCRLVLHRGERMKFEEARLDALRKHPDCEYAEVLDGSTLLLGPVIVVKLWRDKSSSIAGDQPCAIELYPTERSEPNK